MLAVPDHRPAEGCAITLRALHGAAAAAGTTIVAVVAVTKVSSERAERVSFREKVSFIKRRFRQQLFFTTVGLCCRKDENY